MLCAAFQTSWWWAQPWGLPELRYLWHEPDNLGTCELPFCGGSPSICPNCLSSPPPPRHAYPSVNLIHIPRHRVGCSLCQWRPLEPSVCPCLSCLPQCRRLAAVGLQPGETLHVLLCFLQRFGLMLLHKPRGRSAWELWICESGRWGK